MIEVAAKATTLTLTAGAVAGDEVHRSWKHGRCR
jgi:hypothetical protein